MKAREVVGGWLVLGGVMAALVVVGAFVAVQELVDWVRKEERR